MERIGLVNVGLDAIQRGSSQARQTDVAVELDGLVTSIRVQGLLDPIHIVEVEKDNLYELIDGQRRYQAFLALHQEDPEKFSRIPSFVYKNTAEDWEKKTFSLHANLLQAQMRQIDKVNAVTVVYNHFKNIRDTVAATGFSESTIRNYVKLSRLPEEFKHAISSGELSMRTALAVADLHKYDAGGSGSSNIPAMLEIARKMQKLAGRQMNRVIAIKNEEPDRTVPEIIDIVSSKPRKKYDIAVSVELDTYDRIGTYKDREKIDTIQIAAVDLIEDGLDANGV